MRLTYDVVEGLRAVFAVKSLVLQVGPHRTSLR
jgi:hypothetical protein